MVKVYLGVFRVKLVFHKSGELIFTSDNEENNDTDDYENSEKCTNDDGNERLDDKAPEFVFVQFDDQLILKSKRSSTLYFHGILPNY